jgi:putative pyoverdin transport system ATP-binding/permease protein
MFKATPLFQLFRHDLAKNARAIAILALLSGGSNTLVLAAINTASGQTRDFEALWQSMLLFLLSILLYIVTQKRLLVLTAERVESVIDFHRRRLFAAIRDADLRALESLDRAELFGAISRETMIISQSTPLVAVASQSAILVLTTLIYMAYLSPLGLGLWVVGALIGTTVHLSRTEAVRQELEAVLTHQNLMVGRVTDLLEGFKEVKMSHPRADDLSQRFDAASRMVRQRRFSFQNLANADNVFSIVTFYLLTGLLVFVVPVFSDTFNEVVVMTVAASLFLIGPLSNVVTMIPTLANLNYSAQQILNLESQLEQVAEGIQLSATPLPPMTSIRLEKVTFQHREAHQESGFTVGPIDLEIKKGQIVFITGGNGSGKTTLLRLLTGLYPVQHGTLWYNRIMIDSSNRQTYRNQFATVFSDNHLFDELYGIEQIDIELASHLLDLLEIGHKCRIVERHFTDTRLSGGQRKRLALISALLEKKPICVFDEWAADQDPSFRAKFYRVILPMLRAQGTTVIAITHDERYFDTADFRLHMENGLIDFVATPSPSPGQNTDGASDQPKA